MAVSDATKATPNDQSAEQIQNTRADKNQNLNQSVQEAVAASADPTAWSKQPLEATASGIDTAGKSSLYQDLSLPISAIADNQAASNTQGGDGVPANTFQDIGSLLYDSSSLISDLSTSSGGLLSSQDSQLIQSVLTLDSAALNYASNTLQNVITQSGVGDGNTGATQSATPPSCSADGSSGTVTSGDNTVPSGTTTSTDGTGSAGTTTSTDGTGSAGTTTSADSTGSAGTTTSNDGTGSPGTTTSTDGTGSAGITSISGDGSNTTPTPGTGADSSLSPGLQAVANQLGLQTVLNNPGADLVGYGGEGATAEPLSDYGSANADGSFTITNDPTNWGGDLTTSQAFTGTQLDVATVQWNPNEVSMPTWAGGSGTSWPTIWGNTQALSNGDHAEVDVMEQYGAPNAGPSGFIPAASGIIDWQSSQSGGKGQTGSTPIKMSDFDFSQPTEVATLINAQNHTETSYIDGQQVASYSWDPSTGLNQLETQPFNFLLGTGNGGEPFTVDNVQILTPGSSQ